MRQIVPLWDSCHPVWLEYRVHPGGRPQWNSRNRPEPSQTQSIRALTCTLGSPQTCNQECDTLSCVSCRDLRGETLPQAETALDRCRVMSETTTCELSGDAAWVTLPQMRHPKGDRDGGQGEVTEEVESC